MRRVIRLDPTLLRRGLDVYAHGNRKGSGRKLDAEKVSNSLCAKVYGALG